jgi:hypothetical protein
MEFEQFQEKYEKKGSCDFSELLRFAHRYQIESLINYSINLLLLFCEPSELEGVKLLAKIYDHPKLQEFVEYLEKQSGAAVSASSATSIVVASSSSVTTSSTTVESLPQQAIPCIEQVYTTTFRPEKEEKKERVVK